MNNITTKDDLLTYAVRLGEEMKNAIVKRHIDAGQKATGKTSASLRIMVTPKGFQLVGWKYAGSYEEGRAPGNMPPTSVLIEWAKAKGLQFKSDAQMRSFAFLLARKIAREGTYRYRMTPKPDIFRTPIKEMQEKLEQATSAYYQYAVMQELFRTDINKE
jgi:hypothetical protein